MRNLNDVLKGRAAKPKVEQSDSIKIKLEVGDQFLGRLSGTFEFPSQFQAGETVPGWEFEVNGEKHSITHKGNLKYEMARSGAEIGDDVLIERTPDELTKNKRTAQSFAVTAYPAA